MVLAEQEHVVTPSEVVSARWVDPGVLEPDALAVHGETASAKRGGEELTQLGRSRLSGEQHAASGGCSGGEDQQTLRELTGGDERVSDGAQSCLRDHLDRWLAGTSVQCSA